MTVVNDCSWLTLVGNCGNGDLKNVISPFIYYNGQLVQRQDRRNTRDFIVSLNIFGEFDHFEDWAAAQET